MCVCYCGVVWCGVVLSCAHASVCVCLIVCGMSTCVNVCVCAEPFRGSFPSGRPTDDNGAVEGRKNILMTVCVFILVMELAERCECVAY